MTKYNISIIDHRNGVVSLIIHDDNIKTNCSIQLKTLTVTLTPLVNFYLVIYIPYILGTLDRFKEVKYEFAGTMYFLEDMINDNAHPNNVVLNKEQSIKMLAFVKDAIGKSFHYINLLLIDFVLEVIDDKLFDFD